MHICAQLNKKSIFLNSKILIQLFLIFIFVVSVLERVIVEKGC